MWDPSSGATGYTLYYGTSSKSYSIRVNVGDTTRYTMTGLNEKLNYYFVVRAYDNAGESGNSNELVIVATDSNDSVPSAPTSLIIE
ncbi:MAG: fibronectin type III domain-containing protein [Bacteroidetes bacterium]|nr:fibronectin type III domain-containing protein [Bacteroidota bacterium]